MAVLRVCNKHPFDWIASIYECSIEHILDQSSKATHISRFWNDELKFVSRNLE